VHYCGVPSRALSFSAENENIRNLKYTLCRPILLTLDAVMQKRLIKTQFQGTTSYTVTKTNRNKGWAVPRAISKLHHVSSTYGHYLMLVADKVVEDYNNDVK